MKHIGYALCLSVPMLSMLLTACSNANKEVKQVINGAKSKQENPKKDTEDSSQPVKREKVMSNAEIDEIVSELASANHPQSNTVISNDNNSKSATANVWKEGFDKIETSAYEK